MRSIITVIWLGLFMMGGYSLYRITFEVETLESQLTQLNRGILEEHETIHILNAEWTYLTRPQRIEDLSSAHLINFMEAGPAQIALIDQIPFRLPEIEEINAENPLENDDEFGTALANTSAGASASSSNIVKVSATGE